MFRLDTVRLIRKTFNRFFSLFMIVLIGVAFMMGLMSTRTIMEANVEEYDDDMNLIAEYDSATLAAKAVGSNRTSIRDCANGKQKHAGGFIWRYLDQQADLTE